MERLGLEDDVAIESRLVSKTIENAQTRVEGYNFDIRKRVVEYDDVINKQRETIYAERDKVLRNEDLTETVRRSSTTRSTRSSSSTSRRRSRRMGLRGPRPRSSHGPDGEGTRRTTSGSSAPARRSSSTSASSPRSGSTAKRGRARRGRLGDRRAAGPAADDRLAVGRAPDRARRLAPRHRPARLRRHDPLNEFKREAFQLYEELRGSSATGSRRRSSGSRSRASRPPDAGRSGPAPRSGPTAARAGGDRQQRARAGLGRRPRPASPRRGPGRGGGGSAILRGGRAGAPGATDAASPSATQPVMARCWLGAPTAAPARVHAERRAHRPQRSVLV